MDTEREDQVVKEELVKSEKIMHLKLNQLNDLKDKNNEMEVIFKSLMPKIKAMHQLLYSSSSNMAGETSTSISLLSYLSEIEEKLNQFFNYQDSQRNQSFVNQEERTIKNMPSTLNVAIRDSVDTPLDISELTRVVRLKHQSK